MKSAVAFLMILALTLAAEAEINTEIVEYKHGDVTLEGYLAYDKSIDGTRPGVLIVHEWTGRGDYVRMRAEKLASLGYVVFALDMYGKGIRPQTFQDAAAQAKIYRDDRGLMRARAAAGLDQLKNHPLVEPGKIAAIGYCFGGGTVLELARSGADIAGVVSFHGNLDTPDPGDAVNIKAKVLVCHGAADPHVPFEQVQAFQQEMGKAGVDWQLIAYGGAVHSFTNPASGSDPAGGVAYNQKADKRSWQAMKTFFDEIFK